METEQGLIRACDCDAAAVIMINYFDPTTNELIHMGNDEFCLECALAELKASLEDPNSAPCIVRHIE